MLVSVNSTAAQKLSLSDHNIKKDTAILSLTHAEMLNPTFNNPLKKYNYYNCLGIMCRLEYKMQKAIKVPICFRVGSVQYTNKVDAAPVNSDR